MESSSAVHWQSQSCKFRTPQTAPYISQGSGECLSYLPECKELSRKRKERQEAAKASQSSSNSRSPAGSCALTGERETKHTRTHARSGRAERGWWRVGGEEEHPVTQPERNTPGFTSGLLGKCPRKKKRLIDLSRLLVLSFKKFKLSVHMPIASAVFHYGCSLGQRSSFLISWFISNVPCDSSFFPPPSYASLISVKFLIGIKEKEEQWHNGKR